MTSTIKVQVRRAAITPKSRHWCFSNKVLSFDLPLSSSNSRDVDITKNEFDIVREKIASGFPRLKGHFVILAKGENKQLMPCTNESDLMKATQQREQADGVLHLFAQEKANWQRHESQDVSCSCCAAVIQGLRTKCLECEDFNLCHRCDEANVHDQHVMVRCEKPRFFNVALARFEDILPKLCKEVREKHTSGHFERLEPSEIRRFWQKEKRQMEGAGQASVCGKRRGVCEGRHGGVKRERKDEMDEAVECSNCATPVDGMRAKCLECATILCPECDKKGIHGQHVMVRSDRTRFFNRGLPMMKDILPRLCEEMRNREAGGIVQRLTQKDVIQYWRQSRTESKKESGKKGEEMRKKWCRLLNVMATEKGQQVGEEVVGVRQDIDEEGEKEEEMEGRWNKKADGDKQEAALCEKQIQEMRRKWMQGCMQRWRKEMKKHGECNDEDDMKTKQQQIQMWRRYMQSCWKEWREEMKACNLDGSGAIGGDQPGSPRCHVRKVWLQNCWRMWCEEAKKNKSKWLAEGTKRSNGEEGWDEKTRCKPFPGYRFLMRKSWQLMQQQSNWQLESIKASEDLHQALQKPADVVDDEKHSKAAKQMLKHCWLNSCRELWWVEVRKLLVVEGKKKKKDGDKAEDDYGKRKVEEAAHVDVMKLMSAKQVWGIYIQQCWHLWKVLCKRAGLKLEVERKADEHPKRAWVKACWPMWKEEMKKNVELVDDGKGRKGNGRLTWNGRPFTGWRQLMMKSWQMMNKYLRQPEQSDEEVKQRQLECLKRAWMKMIEKEMRNLKVAEKERQSGDGGAFVEDSEDGVKKEMSVVEEGEGRMKKKELSAEVSELVDKSMKQYWKMWQERWWLQDGKENMEIETVQGHALCEVCGERLRLRLKLSLKEQPI